MERATIWHWVIVAIVVLLLFGRGKISELIGDAARGIEAFRNGMGGGEARRPPARPNRWNRFRREMIAVLTVLLILKIGFGLF